MSRRRPGDSSPSRTRTRRELELLRDDLLVPGRLRADLAVTLRPLARSSVRALHLVRPVWRAMRRLGLLERDAFRTALHAPRLPAAHVRRRAWPRTSDGSASTCTASGTATEPSSAGSWCCGWPGSTTTSPGAGPVSRCCREPPGRPGRCATARHTTDLRPCSASRSWSMSATPSWNVWCANGMVCGYVYEPPLDDYAGAEFAEPSPDPSAARWFASHVLPADPLLARRITGALTRERATAALPVIRDREHAPVPPP
ncbi:hypothetical protein QQY66_04275 [Streptomyces sp. DG2A-72]|uniref:hypothetical protein n=1 Tax=Streptomyces sp. DG2A-72 TaxID=3051386 RepID=UPI00265BFD62|nr:hypothetical protein [Streptomyces sp. DG2A-72]MDO0930929.1 hypothetical protein [Streptomyces sp. DG2A-72]